MTVGTPGSESRPGQTRARESAVQLGDLRGGTVHIGEVHAINVYQPAADTPAVFTGWLTSTVCFPRTRFPDLPGRIDVTSVPTKWFGGSAALYQDLEVSLLAEVGPESLAHATSAVCWGGTDTDAQSVAELFRLSRSGDLPGTGSDESAETTAGKRLEVARRASYVVYGETAVIEESPARRTSPAAVEASKLAGRILIGGTAGVGVGAGASALVHSAEHGPMVIVIGASVTLILAVAGGGTTMLWHWLGKKLDV